jgi:hypothetical protein
LAEQAVCQQEYGRKLLVYRDNSEGTGPKDPLAAGRIREKPQLKFGDKGGINSPGHWVGSTRQEVPSATLYYSSPSFLLIVSDIILLAILDQL